MVESFEISCIVKSKRNNTSEKYTQTHTHTSTIQHTKAKKKRAKDRPFPANMRMSKDNDFRVFLAFMALLVRKIVLLVLLTHVCSFFFSLAVVHRHRRRRRCRRLPAHFVTMLPQNNLQFYTHFLYTSYKTKMCIVWCALCVHFFFILSLFSVHLASFL